MALITESAILATEMIEFNVTAAIQWALDCFTTFLSPTEWNMSAGLAKDSRTAARHTFLFEGIGSIGVGR
jgi:hypothetical protein